MLKTFDDFLAENPNCSGLSNSKTAQEIFNFLSQENIIIEMINFSEMNKPALAACVIDLERFFNAIKKPDIDLRDGFYRQAVGRMIKTILEPFGYIPTTQKIFSKTLSSTYFTSAKCYNLLGTAKFKVVKRIIKI